MTNQTVNVVFFGISNLGIKILKNILKNKKFNIIFAITREKAKPHVVDIEKKYFNLIKQNNLNLKKNLINIKKLPQNTIGIIGGYDGIVKKKDIEKFDLGIYNIHFGIIPYVRGCNPIMWSILNNHFGYSIYKIDKKIDKGRNVYSKLYKIRSNLYLNSKNIYDLLSKSSFIKFKNTILKNPNNISFKKNLKLQSNYFNKHLPNNSYISWNWKPELIKKFSNAFYFPPYKSCRTKYKSKDIYLEVVDFKKKKSFKKDFGRIIKRNRRMIYIIVNGGLIKAKLHEEYSIICKGIKLKSIESKINSIPINYNKQKLIFKEIKYK